MNMRSLLGATALAAACSSLALSCSDDDGDGVGGAGGTMSAGSGGSGVAGSGMSGGGMGGGSSGSGGSGMGGSSQTGGLSFAEDVYPILVGVCGDCHSGTNPASFSFAQSDSAAAYQAVIDEGFDGVTPVYEAIIARTENGGMPLDSCFQGNPPGSPGCLTVEEFETIQQWSQSGSPPPP